MGAEPGSGCLIPLRVNSRRLVQVEYRPESGGILGRLSLARYSLLICASCPFNRPYHRFCLLHAFVVLTGRIGVSDNAGFSLQIRLLALDQHRTERHPAVTISTPI